MAFYMTFQRPKQVPKHIFSVRKTGCLESRKSRHEYGHKGEIELTNRGNKIVKTTLLLQSWRDYGFRLRRVGFLEFVEDINYS
jgi:hypothetical protein